MNVTEMQILTPGGFLHVALPLQAATRNDPYILKSADGLGAENIVPNLYGRAAGTRANFYNMVLKDRVVTLTIKLNPQYQESKTIGDLRDTFYRLIQFNRQAKIELRFLNGENDIASLIGFINDVDGSPFDSDQKVTLIMKFDDPILRANDYTVIDTPELVMPSPSWTDADSTAPHGYKMELQFTANASNLTIRGIDTPNYAPFKINYAFHTGDQLYLSSEDGNRYLYVLKATIVVDGEFTYTSYSDSIYITDKIGLGSIWPTMVQGITNIGFSTNNLIVNEVSYRKAYWGV